MTYRRRMVAVAVVQRQATRKVFAGAFPCRPPPAMRKADEVHGWWWPWRWGQHLGVRGQPQLGVSWQDLKDHFKTIGPVLHADVMLERGHSLQGLWSCDLQNARDAATAISQLHDTGSRASLCA